MMHLLQRLTKNDLQILQPDPIWINPLGGIGDILMLCGVLKLVHDTYPSLWFNLIRRSRYTNLLQGHPAIVQIGFPPVDSRIIGSDYWSLEEYGRGDRAFQILARKFGLEPPVEEQLYIPEADKTDDLLEKFIPWKKTTILIAPVSDSPRKMAPLSWWVSLVQNLREKDVFVIQTGRAEEEHISGAYSLLGLTDPRQLIAIVKKVNAVITVDNFVMHAAHLAGTPAVVLWGPTSDAVYGYREQVHIKASKDHCSLKAQCLGPKFPENYATPCPLDKKHCMTTLKVENIVASLISNNYF
jgi:ADP-heptose:LPS heptosyltransferase